MQHKYTLILYTAFNFTACTTNSYVDYTIRQEWKHLTWN